MEPRDQVAQLFMVGIDIADGAPSQDALDLVSDSGVGSVLLLGNNAQGVDTVSDITDQFRDAAAEPEGVKLLIAADQEGGQVQRLSGPGFPTMPPAIEQADLSDADLEAHAEEWAAALVDAGIDLNLAPVADVVPEDNVDANEPIGVLQRGFGPDPDTVHAKAQDFIDGMHAHDIASTVKHFPGLGYVTGNTDLTADVVDDVTTTADLDVFTGYDNLDAVMVSSATYTQLDPDEPALYSPVIVTDLLRDDLGFDGVIISDDLGDASAAQILPAEERGTAFLTAGGDLVINADEDALNAMIDNTLDAMQNDPDFAAAVRDKVVRVLELKATTGEADCVPD